MHVVRVQHSEKTVSAPDEDTAMERLQAEMDRPYGLLTSWTTDDITVEIVGVENRLGDINGTVPGGPLLFSTKAAAEQLGISRTVLYEVIRSGEIEVVRIGRRILISRDSLQRFIESHSRIGYVPN
jgi:excisionase family DNA binding protein